MVYIPGGSEPRREPLGPPAYVPPIGSVPPVSPAAWPLPQPPRPKRRRLGLILGLVAAGVILLVGGGVLALALAGHSPVSVPGVPSTMTVHGTLTIAGDCHSFGYDDIHSGTEVTVTDESNKVLAVADLHSDGLCAYQFELDNVPTGAKFYGVTISHRGTLHYTEAQMRQGVNLSLGN